MRNHFNTNRAWQRSQALKNCNSLKIWKSFSNRTALTCHNSNKSNIWHFMAHCLGTSIFKPPETLISNHINLTLTPSQAKDTFYFSKEIEIQEEFFKCNINMTGSKCNLNSAQNTNQPINCWMSESLKDKPLKSERLPSSFSRSFCSTIQWIFIDKGPSIFAYCFSQTDKFHLQVDGWFMAKWLSGWKSK